MNDDTVPWDNLDPGIRRLVRLLVDHGFDTTDSGDGVSKFDADGKPLPGWESDDPAFEVVMRVPHVFIQADPGSLASECDRLLRVLRDEGITITAMGLSGEGRCIQGTYDPTFYDPDTGRGYALIALTGVSDADLRAKVNP